MGATGYIIKSNGGRGSEARKEVVVSSADGTIDVEKVETFDKVDFRIKTTYDGYETINVGSPASGGYFKAAHIKFNEKNRRYRLVCILNGGSYTPVAKDFAIYYIKFGWRTGGVNADHWYIEEYSRQGNGAYVSLEQIALNEYNVLIHTPTGYAYANIGILKEDKEPDVTIDHFNNNTTRYTPTGTIIETETPAWKNGALVDTNPEDLKIRNGLLQLADRSSIDGLGYVILRPDKTFSEQVTQSNCIYEVRYNFAVDDNFVAPENIRLKYNGGSLVVNGVSTYSSLVKASEVGLIPNTELFALHNAKTLVLYTNLGYSIDIDGSYCVAGLSSFDEPSLQIHNNVDWRNGELIVVAPNNGSFVFAITSEISVDLMSIHITGSHNLVNGERRILFKVKAPLYLPEVYISNCEIEKVQVYTHIGQDVNQTTEKDGVKRMIISNNHVHDIPSSFLYCPNIKSEGIVISGNYIHGIRNNAFAFYVENTYSHAEGTRISMIEFLGNILDNSDYIIDDSTATYNCMCVVEGETCIFADNTISNLICTSNSTGVVYPFYLSCRNVDIINNTITDVISFAENLSSYDIFKCKGLGSDGSIISNSSRRITGNKYYLTKDCVERYGDLNNPPRRTMVGLMQSFENVVISDNIIEAYCEFGFGGGYNVYHKYYEFTRNIIVVDRLFESSLFRTTPTNETCRYLIHSNKVTANIIPSKNLSLLWDNGSGKPVNCSVVFYDNDFGYYGVPLNSGNFETDKFKNKLSLIHQDTFSYVRYAGGLDDDISFNYVDPTITYVNCLNLKKFKHSFLDVNHRFYYRIGGISTDAGSKGTLLLTMRSEGEEVKAMLVLADTEVFFVDQYGKKTSRERVTDLARFSITLTDADGVSLGEFHTLKSRTEIYLNQNTKPIQVEAEWRNGQTTLVGFETKSGEVNKSDTYYLNAKWKSVVDVSNKALIYFDGQTFRNAEGRTASILTGDTASRPTLLTTDAGYQYFDTNLGRPIYWTGAKWVDANGNDLQ